ncbi:MAG TPA: amino acid permease, partial [Actinomycetota bacterium]|nr:amino acid permease [Actinomycetota bacterium]
GFATPAAAAPPPPASPGHAAPVAVALAFPVAMALATGVEAPASAIAQLGQLDDRGRRRFGRITLWLTLAIVGGLTVGITALAVRLGAGIPREDSTLIADVARAVGSPGLFATFQATSSLLLLAAASSSFQAGPGLLKALAARDGPGGAAIGILPAWMGRTNRHHTPYWGVLLFLAVSAAVVAAAGGRDQELVLFYAVAVFVSFFAGLVAMARFSLAEGRWASFVSNAVGAAVVGFTLVVNAAKGYPLASLSASLLIAGIMYRSWVRAGRPRGVSEVEAIADPAPGSASDLPGPRPGASTP